MTSRKTHDQGEQHGGAAATALMQNLAEQVGELGNERCDFGIGHNGCLQADRHGCEEWTGHEQDETTPPPVKHRRARQLTETGERRVLTTKRQQVEDVPGQTES